MPGVIDRRAAVQYAVARVLADAPEFPEAIRRILEAICKALNWRAGAFWIPDSEQSSLRCVAVWSAHPGKFQGFLKSIRESNVAAASGLPGRIRATQKAAWIKNIAADENYSPATTAMSEGLRAALGFPVRIGGDFLGVMEFFCDEPQPADEDLLGLMEALGSQLAQFMRRVAAQQALRESEARKSAMLEAALNCIVSVDHNGNVTEWNRAAEETFGFSRQRALGRPLTELIIPERLRDAHTRGFSRQIATGESTIMGTRFETYAVREDGREFPVELVVTRLRWDGPPAFTAYIRDLTEQRAIEAEREELLSRERAAHTEAELERGRMGEALSKSPFLIIMTNGPSHRIEFLNAPALERFHLSSDAIGKPLREVYPEVEKYDFLAIFSRVYATGETISGREAPITHPRWGGEERYFDFVFQALRDADGRVARVLGQAVEVTDSVLARRNVETELSIRNDFLSVASHELLNPINSLRLQLASIVRGQKKRPDQSIRGWVEDRVGKAIKQVDVLGRLVAQLLDVSRINAGWPSPELGEVDLVELTREIIDRLAEDRNGCETSLHCEGSAVGLWDRLKIDQVIANMLFNAYKYGGGKPVEVSIKGAAEVVRLHVRDHGIGISLENHTRIFERFERAIPQRYSSYGGFGLGLWIGRQIVEAHGGKLSVESVPGHGARFTMELPRRPEIASTDGSPNTAYGAPRQPEIKVTAENEVPAVEDSKTDLPPRKA